jgi:hypothetical protein
MSHCQRTRPRLLCRTKLARLLSLWTRFLSARPPCRRNHTNEPLADHDAHHAWLPRPMLSPPHGGERESQPPVTPGLILAAPSGNDRVSLPVAHRSNPGGRTGRVRLHYSFIFSHWFIICVSICRVGQSETQLPCEK